MIELEEAKRRIGSESPVHGVILLSALALMEQRGDRAESRAEAAESMSEARRQALMAKSDEVRIEWTRAENAEGRVTALEAELAKLAGEIKGDVSHNCHDATVRYQKAEKDLDEARAEVEQYKYTNKVQAEAIGELRAEVERLKAEIKRGEEPGGHLCGYARSFHAQSNDMIAIRKRVKVLTEALESNLSDCRREEHDKLTRIEATCRKTLAGGEK